jgi:hypothetical protein
MNVSFKLKEGYIDFSKNAVATLKFWARDKPKEPAKFSLPGDLAPGIWASLD